MRICRFIFIVFTVITIGCGPTVIFEEKQNVTSPWAYDKVVQFDWNIQDTAAHYDLILEVSHLDSFLYQNLYTKLITTLPDGNAKEDIISLDLRKFSGEPQGKCSGKICKVPFLIQHNVKFVQSGKYNITIAQNTRDSLLKHIQSISFKIQETVDE